MSFFKDFEAYAKDNPKGYWFKRRPYGWGWVPVTKEGWLVTIVFIALFLLLGFSIDEKATQQDVNFMFFLPLVILLAAFFRILITKGEKPKWQWGLPKAEEKENE